MDFRKTTIKELHEKLVNSEISSEDLVNHANKIISEKNDDLNAMIEVFDDIATPKTINKDSFISGIPVAIKDNILFKGKLATAASHILDGYVLRYNFHSQEYRVIQFPFDHY